MKKIILILILLVSVNKYIQAQNCNCVKELDFVINYYEENLPGFHDNVNEANKNWYHNFKKQLHNKASKFCGNRDSCFNILHDYVEFFQDNHSSIYKNNIVVNESDTNAVKAFLKSDKYLKTEVLPLPTNRTFISLNDIENDYITDDSTYVISIVKNQQNNRDYVGIIKESKTKLWTKGQVKLTLKKINDSLFDMIFYFRNHDAEILKNNIFKNGIIETVDGKWNNVHLTAENLKQFEDPISSLYSFKELDSETNYIQIFTFDGNMYNELKNFYKKYDSCIQSKPYLIIDVRDNGGGSDRNVNPLLKYIYTKPFYDDTVEIYVTKENIRRWENVYLKILKSNDTLNYSNEYLKDFKKELDEMKAAKNKSFIIRNAGKLIKDTILKYPKKVAIIMNKYCASSCETLLFYALESDKTILVGENSGGYTGYGEILSVNTPIFNFSLGCTLTRYKKQHLYDGKGVTPNYFLNNNKDWLEQTIQLLKR